MSAPREPRRRSTAPHEPPRAATWILARLLPADRRDCVLDDARRDFVRRRRRHRTAAAWAGYGREILAAARWTVTRATARLRPPRRADLESVLLDVRQALRAFRAAPGPTALIVLTLALGIGANSAIFSLAHGILLSPLPYAEPHRLVTLHSSIPDSGMEPLPLSGPDFLDVRESVDAFDGVAGVWTNETGLVDDGPARPVVLGLTTENFFQVLGVSPAVGRAPLPGEAGSQDMDTAFAPGAPPPPTGVVLDHGLWQQMFASDPDVVGSDLRLASRPVSVVGVLPPEFELLLPSWIALPRDVDVWETFRSADLDTNPRDARWVNAVARLRPGVGLEEARAQLDALATRLRERHPTHQAAGTELLVRPLHEGAVQHVRPVVALLATAVGLVLLVACANVAALLLVQAAGRRQEIAVRAALGAGRARIVRQMLTESAVLGLAGAVVGSVLAGVALGPLLRLAPLEIPRLATVDLDLPVLLFSLAVGLGAAMLFGSAPALVAGRPDVAQRLGGRSAGGDRSARRPRDLLVVAEVAVALVLVVAAGLLLRTFVHLQQLDPAFRVDGVHTFRVSLPFRGYETPEPRIDYFRRLAAELDRIPGVESTGAVYPLPLTPVARAYRGSWARDPGDQVAWESQKADLRTVTPGLLDTLDLRIVAGRPLLPADDRADAEPVVLIDEALARRAFPDEDPLEKRLWVERFDYDALRFMPTPTRVVGVVEASRYVSLSGADRGAIYRPLSQVGDSQLFFAVRTGDPAGLRARVRAIAAGIDPAVPVSDFRPLAAYAETARAPARFLLVLVAAFGGLTLLLAGVGLHGVLATLVRQRAAEIGIRLALGAEPGSVLGLVLRHGLLLLSAGIAAGLVVAWVGSRVLASSLAGVGSRDPLTYVTAAVLLALVGIASAWWPARRAARVDPARVLRA